MDRYATSTRTSSSDYLHLPNHPRPRSDRSLPNHQSRLQNDKDLTLNLHTRRAARRGAVSHALTNESDHAQPRDRSRGSDEPRRDRSPITLFFDYNDPREFGGVNTSAGYAVRGPDPRDCADDDEVSPRTRGGRGLGLGRARGGHGRSELGSESHSGSRREGRGSGSGGRRSMARGSNAVSGSEVGGYAARRGGREVRGGESSSRSGRGGSSEENRGVRGRREGASGYGGGSRR